MRLLRGGNVEGRWLLQHTNAHAGLSGCGGASAAHQRAGRRALRFAGVGLAQAGARLGRLWVSGMSSLEAAAAAALQHSPQLGLRLRLAPLVARAPQVGRKMEDARKEVGHCSGGGIR